MMYRFHPEFCLRLPRTKPAERSLLNEIDILQAVQGNTSLRVPEPVFLGVPQDAYPIRWAVYRWIEGSPFTREECRDEEETAERLATFIIELKTNIRPRSFPTAGRPPLAHLHAKAESAIQECGNSINQEATRTAWQQYAEAPPFSRSPCLIHADLIPTNLILTNGQLTGILDFGSAGLGDPAFDLIPAWASLGKLGRKRFQQVLDYPNAVWQRAKAYALYQALLIIPYYWNTYPEFSIMAQRTIQAVITDSPP